jgi:hypothetical protein
MRSAQLERISITERARQNPGVGRGERIAHAFPDARDAAFRVQILCPRSFLAAAKNQADAGRSSPLHQDPGRGRFHASPPAVTDNGRVVCSVCF